VYYFFNLLSALTAFSLLAELDTSFAAVSGVNKGFVLTKYGRIVASGARRRQRALNARQIGYIQRFESGC
jgi:hypothetical protein